MATFIWSNGESTFLLKAEDEETAYRMAIATRLESGNSLAEAVGWFREHDTLEELMGEITCAPYSGDLPED